MSDGYEHYLQRYFAFAVAKHKTAWGLPMPDYWEAINQAVSRVDINELQRVTVVQIFAQAMTSKMEVNAHELTAEEAISGLAACKKDVPPLVSTYMVVCSGAGPIIAGPSPDRNELLAAVGNAEDYNLGVDLPVVIQFEGTPLQIETFKQLKRHVSVDDPNFYIEDGDEETDNGPEIVFEDMPSPTQIQRATELITPDAATEPPPPTARKKRGGQLSMLP